MLVQFDTQDPHEVIHRFKPIGEIPELNPETYAPRPSTPLLEAFGRGINDLESGLGEIKEEGYKKMKKNKQELILKIGAAGGSITLWSVSAKDGARSFVVKTDESTLKGMMTEEDAEGIAFKSKTAPLHSFADAMIALGHYQWHLLYPMFVHEDFRDPVLKAVRNLGGEKLANRWQQALNDGLFVHFT
jgi:hypothetical protein